MKEAFSSFILLPSITICWTSIFESCSRLIATSVVRPPFAISHALQHVETRRDMPIQS